MLTITSEQLKDNYYIDMENKIENLPNAPIKKVTIEVISSENRTEEELRLVNEELKKDYPEEKQNMLNELSINISETGQHISHKQESNGSILSSGKKKVLIGNSKLVFSDGSKYENGARIISEYKNIWDKYTKNYKPEKIERIGLRYENNFQIGFEEIKEINIRPVMGETKSTILMGQVFMKFAVSSPEKYKADGILSLAITPLENERLDIAFDIDVFEKDIDYRNPDTIIATLDRLRNFKNELFFANILDANERFK